VLKLAPGEPGTYDAVFQAGAFTFVVSRYLSESFGPFTIDATPKGFVIRSKLPGSGSSCGR